MNKEDVLYLPIKEGITANRYLLKDGKYLLNPEVTESGK